MAGGGPPTSAPSVQQHKGFGVSGDSVEAVSQEPLANNHWNNGWLEPISRSVTRKQSTGCCKLTHSPLGVCVGLIQEELLALKTRISTLALKKAAAGSSPAACFPLTLTWEVPLPPEAERYDVEDVKVGWPGRI